MLHQELRHGGNSTSIHLRAGLISGYVLCGHGVWFSWSVVVVMLLQVGYPYSLNGLFSLIAIAGMAGGSLRIALGFLLPQFTSPWALGLSMALLVLPALGMAVALQYHATLETLQVLALLSGLGGGCYSLYLQRLDTSLHHHQRHRVLGLGIGIGQLGMAASLILLPWVVTLGFWQSPGHILVDGKESSTLLGSFAGDRVWISNIGWAWSLLLTGLLLVLAALSGWERWGGGHRGLAPEQSRRTHNTVAQGMASTSWAIGVGLLVSMLGCWFTLPPEANGMGLQVSRELVMAAMLIIMLALLRLFPQVRQDNAHSPYSIFNNKHTWVMSVMCSMSLGSFLGLAAALPLTLEWTFGYVLAADGMRQPNPNAPGVFTYVWMGPFIGILMRPVGGWVADRFGGARTTQCCALVMMLAAAGAAFYLGAAYRAPEPEQYFFPFCLLMFVLFSAAGAGHASVLFSVERLFPASQQRHLNTWMAGIAAYGMFYIPGLLGEQLQRGTPEQAMVSFALFYALCLLLNGWFYLRREGTFYNP